MDAATDGVTRSRIGIILALCWFSLAVYAIARVLQVFPGPVPSLAVVALHVIPPASFALFHGVVRYRLRGALAFFAICLLVGGAIENIGVLTGFPFGRYYFTSLMGPKILLVPAMLALAYVGMAYLSWTLATLIVGTVDEIPKREGSSGNARVVTVPLLASLIMVAWDFAMEPYWSTILRAWIWRDGGPYFGVPISNFFGWFFTVYIIFQLFALYARRRSGPIVLLPRSYWYLPILCYAISAAGNLLLLLPHTGPSVVSDPGGVQWQVAGITSAAALVSIFVMGAFALIAWARLSDGDADPGS